jgi:hypothetical protein
MSILCYWLWEFLHSMAPAYDGLHARLSPIFIFGIVACIFLFRDAKWARISIGMIAILLAVTGLWDIWQQGQQGWMRADKWADDAMVVLSVATAVLLFFPRNGPVA